MDFENYIKELYKKSQRFVSDQIVCEYNLPNWEELHSMICGYAYDFEDKQIFDNAESIDFVKYEKELWKLERWNK